MNVLFFKPLKTDTHKHTRVMHIVVFIDGRATNTKLAFSVGRHRFPLVF